MIDTNGQSSKLNQHNQSDSQLYIGLMSGTSIDGIDVALVEFNQQRSLLKASYFLAFDKSLKQNLEALCLPSLLSNAQLKTEQCDPLEAMATLDSQLGQLFGQAVNQLLAENKLDKSSIKAIGSHGQTIRHRPYNHHPFTLQIGDPNQIAFTTGITTVADFRRMDMAAGGQAAPLVPAFHEAQMRSPQENRVILNLGGISNITLLPQCASLPVIGFDTGPANTLLDSFFKLHNPNREQDFDNNSEFAQTGKCDRRLLDRLLEDAYFKMPPPKSTGREYFSLNWLQQHLQQCESPISAQSIQATLLEFTTETVADAIEQLQLDDYQVYCCGGGSHNPFMIQQLSAKLGRKVRQTSELGVDGDFLEAMTFAWLAKRRLENQPGNLPAVTGASQPKVLGAIYHP